MLKGKRQDSYSVITAILGKNASGKVINDDVLDLCRNVLMIRARGTLVRANWYESFLPAINPEQDVVQLLTPSKNTEAVMNRIIENGALYQSGAGAVYAVKCKSTGFLDNSKPPEKFEKIADHFHVQSDLTGIFCIVQKGQADSIAKEAMKAGSPGPIVMYGQGKGIRDRMGLIRMAISPEKEIIYSVVDNTDADHVFETMITAGDLHLPGTGFIYMMPLESGLVNIRSVFSSDRKSAIIIFYLKMKTIKALVYVVLIFCIVQIVDNVLLKPIIYSQSVDLHPLIVLFSILLGGMFFGVWGLIFAVPVVGVLKVVISHVAKEIRFRYQVWAEES